MKGELFLQNIFLEEWQGCKAKNGNVCLRKPGLVSVALLFLTLLPFIFKMALHCQHTPGLSHIGFSYFNIYKNLENQK